MVKNLFVTAFRSLERSRFFSTLNISGLTIGVAVFLVIALYVHFEKSYEDFIPNRNSIYRVTLEQYNKNQLLRATAENHPAVGPVLAEDLPEVISQARLYNQGYKNNVIITYQKESQNPIAIKAKSFLYAEPSFLKMMNYELTAIGLYGSSTHKRNWHSQSSGLNRKSNLFAVSERLCQADYYCMFNCFARRLVFYGEMGQWLSLSDYNFTSCLCHCRTIGIARGFAYAQLPNPESSEDQSG
jgi:hypothetical protein